MATGAMAVGTTVTVINRRDAPVTVGVYLLQPGQGACVTIDDFIEARARYGPGLESPNAPIAAELAAIELEQLPEPDEYSLDVLGDPADADLAHLSWAELVETARRAGIVPGHLSRQELIKVIREYTD